MTSELPRVRWRRSAVAIAMAATLAATACTGGSGAASSTPAAPTADASREPTPSAELVLEASDGSARIELPAGALPDEVDPAEVSITAIEPPDPGDDADDDALTPARLYVLEPDGAQLASPATITLRLSAADLEDGSLMVLHVAGDTVEGLEPRLAAADAEGLEIVVEVSHFSVVAVYASSVVRVEEIAPAADNYPVGETVPFELIVRPRSVGGTTPVRVWVDGIIRNEVWDVALASRQIIHGDGRATTQGALGTDWIQGVPPAGTSTGPVTAAAAFPCASAGDGAISYYLAIKVPIFRMVDGAIAGEFDAPATIVTWANVTCVDQTPAQQALAALLPEGAQVTGTAAYEPVHGDCRGRSFSSPVRVTRGTDDVEFAQLHGRGLEQLSEGFVLPFGGLVTTAAPPSHSEVYLLVFIDSPDGEGGEMAGVNVHGPPGSIPLAEQADRVRAAFSQVLVSDLLDDVDEGFFDRLAEILELGPGACINSIEIALDPLSD